MVKYRIVWRGHGRYTYPVKQKVVGKQLRHAEERNETLYSGEEADEIIRNHSRRKN